MEIKIPVKLLKEYLKKHPDESVQASFRYDDDERLKEFNIDDFSEAQLSTLVSLAEKNKDFLPGCKGMIQKISTYKNIKVNPGGRPVRRLEDLEQALRLFCKSWTNHWGFIDKADHVLPYYITSIEYTPYDDDSETPASCRIQFQAIRRGHNESFGVTWHSQDLNEGKTCAQLLAEQMIFVPTPKLLADYEKSMARYKVVKDKMGEQFTADGEGAVVKGRWDRGLIAMVRDGMAAKLVMDDNPEEKADEDDNEGMEFGDDNGLTKDSYWRDASTKEQSGHIALPVHPFVQLFDLDRHGFVIVNSNQLTEYAWNPAIGDKLILPKEHKDVITILMDTANEEIADIIAGKSGGTIIISTGDPGTGKTLTAEVTSEVTKRPLYKVQCSQLGTDEEAIEKKLSKVLARSIRWKAILLIDEADVYVRERGNDIQQNAIVGVFLRVLEYYRGILFLTSNKATVIDDAIMSRATAHLKYGKPTDCELTEIWRVLSVQFGLKLQDKMIDELCQTFPGIVGRDVKNLLKLAIRYTRRNDSKITVDLFKLLSVHKDITPKTAPFKFTETASKK